MYIEMADIEKHPRFEEWTRRFCKLEDSREEIVENIVRGVSKGELEFKPFTEYCYEIVVGYLHWTKFPMSCRWSERKHTLDMFQAVDTSVFKRACESLGILPKEPYVWAEVEYGALY